MDAGVIKGVDYFFGDILPKAFSSKEWNENSITIAFQWANFCEELFKNYKDQPSKEKLDYLIHQLALKFKRANDELCFNDLNTATETLCKAFFENPSVENDLIESVLLKVKNDRTSFEAVKEECELNSLCCELLDAVKPIRIKDSDRSFHSEIMALLYLISLEESVKQMTSEDQVEQFISSCLEKLCESDSKMMKLFHVLMLKLAEDSPPSMKDVQQFAINWTMFKVYTNKNHPLAEFIWKWPSKLRAVSLNNSIFLNFYLDFLSQCSSSLTFVQEQDESKWIPRCSGHGLLSFDEVLNHFRSLLGRDDSVCECTKNYLLNMLNTQPEKVIWKEIFSRVT